MTETPREIILKILTEISENGIYSHVAIRGALDRYQYLPRRDRAFIKRVCEGTLERMIEIDYIIDSFSSVQVDKMKPVIRDIMRSSVYQICFMDAVPDSAAVNEAVTLAQKRGFYNLKGFVNGVLRTVSRSGNSIPWPDEEKDPVRFFSVRFSMPEWIVRTWFEEFGPIITRKMLEASLGERPVTVRFKTDRIDKAEILASLEGQGVKVRKAPYLPYAYYISEFSHLPALAAFRNGWIFPQDISSMLVTEAAAPKNSDYVIDMCAAPGGKSLHMADRMGGFGMIEARDLTQDKVDMIRENVQRANLVNIRPIMADALTFDKHAEGLADIVLCDLPCSGLGVIGRKPDIKYRATEDRVNSLVELQRGILRNAAAYVRPGGHLIYSTCTVGRKENLDNARWFASHFPFEFESLDPYIPKLLRRISTAEGYLQLVPGVHETDGFFIARFRKKRL